MFLSDREIRSGLLEGTIQVLPAVDPENIRPIGIRLHLAEHLLVPKASAPLDLIEHSDPAFDPVEMGKDGFLLPPGGFVLGASKEHVKLDPSMVCLIDGRSTVARIGLLAHCAAMTFDQIQAEFRSVTFELANVGPFTIRLRAGAPVGLLLFACLSSPILQASNPQYNGQSKPEAPTLGMRRQYER